MTSNLFAAAALAAFLLSTSVPANAEQYQASSGVCEYVGTFEGHQDAGERIQPQKKIQAARLGPVYQPGVSVDGHVVAPADLAENPAGQDLPSPNVAQGALIDVPAQLTFPLKAQLHNYLKYGILEDEGGVPAAIEMEANIGSVSINTHSGRVLYNGADITGKVSEYCVVRKKKQGPEPGKAEESE